MLDFRRRIPSRRAVGVAPSVRLLTLVAVSAVVLLLISSVQYGGFFERLVGSRSRPVAQRQAPAEPDTSAEAETPGTFRTADAAPASAPAARDDRPLFPGVRADYLSQVRDDAVFLPSESDAWFHLLDILARTEPTKLAKHSLGAVGYAQLLGQPASYRGQLVTFEGTIRRATHKKAARNSYGIEQYYQLWLQPRGSGDNLIAVYCLKLPDGFPTGESVAAQVSLVGFSYKRWAYASVGGVTTAPLVLSGTLDWHKPAPADVAAGPVVTGFIIRCTLIALGIAGIAIAVIWRRGARRRGTRFVVGGDDGDVSLSHVFDAPAADASHDGAHG